MTWRKWIDSKTIQIERIVKKKPYETKLGIIEDANEGIHRVKERGILENILTNIFQNNYVSC